MVEVVFKILQSVYSMMLASAGAKPTVTATVMGISLR